MKICAVIVTYNRLKDLKKCLKEYDMQEEKIDGIIVVNNNSSDDTKKFLDEWKNESSIMKREVINLKNNIGGSGRIL